ncbi:Tetratricopeptide repeat-containing protein [Stigmatella aurantiaca]|uniref:Tetratricopeptide repeat-containing protein n=1 Tax=Stigmatella aurantiaca TaxID=41 RepID=A0A1H7HSE9_STIAU|nr:Tetratricopeptide repeat-containing protein [Stigmatella aurantiaca]
MTSSPGRRGKSPPGPVKIHHFEKRSAPRASSAPREPEVPSHAHPTLPEMALHTRPTLPEIPLHAHPTLPEFSLQPPGESPTAPPPAPRPSQEAPPARRKRAPAASETRSRKGQSPEDSAEGASAPGVSERLASARRLIAEGKLDAARGVLERLVALGVAGAPVQTLLGGIYLAQGAMDRALACFEEALARDPSDLAALMSRGQVRLSLGELRRAQEDLQTVLESGMAGSPLVEQARQLLERIGELRNRKRR